MRKSSIKEVWSPKASEIMRKSSIKEVWSPKATEIMRKSNINEVWKCDVGQYGDGCMKSCSQHCAGKNNSCNPVNCTCDLGCDPGYQGDLRTQECSIGFYGASCNVPTAMQ
ncbi:hypothetical protein RRG08_062102 [Elysia crispata]|uniref:Uncharacterized protein n=1 Tax=Elysia crispata TaxID=231223 RepID=A0AAE1D1I2_9GAST|nr:hypothetical protein RRG08_062102 [Elysia crispata]